MIETNFKHTDIGVIPHDWEVKTLGDIGSIRMCKRIMKHQTSDTGDIPFYKIGTFGKVADAYISQELYKEFRNKYNFPKKGDILLSAAGTIGRTVVYDGKPAYFQDSNIVWIENNKQFVINELLYYLYHRVNWITDTGTIPRIYNGNVGSILIPLPPTLAEQEKIANALSKIDQLINDLGALIEKKKAIKQGTMQDLLTAKRRLKGFTGKWVKKNIWEVTIWDKKFNGVEDYKQPEVKKYPYALAKELFAMEDNSGDVFLLSTGGYSGWTTEKKAGQFMCHGEVVTIPWGGVAIVKYTNGKFVTADNRLATSQNTQVLSNKFLYLAMLIKTDVLNTFYRGASIKHPSMEDVLNLEIFLPPTIAEQNAIANVLSSMDTEITNLEQKRDKYIAIKQGMMQNLLTGKIRLI